MKQIVYVKKFTVIASINTIHKKQNTLSNALLAIYKLKTFSKNNFSHTTE